MALAAKQQGAQVFLSSYTFSDTDSNNIQAAPCPGLFSIGGDATFCGYCPEGWLSRWWHKSFQEVQPVWLYKQIGVASLSRIFSWLSEKLQLTAIIVVDGGVDGLFHGTEYDTATPSIDAISIFAAFQQQRLRRFYSFCAFGTEGTNHEVRHLDALERIAQLTQAGGFLGVSSLLATQAIGRNFLDAVNFIHSHHEPRWHSNMVGSICAAMLGQFGHQQINLKTDQWKIWISPLTNLYWHFQLEAVATAKPFWREALETDGIAQIQTLFDQNRQQIGSVPRRDIPI